MGYLNGKFYDNNISQTSCSRSYSMTRFQDNYDPDMNNKFKGDDILFSRDTIVVHVCTWQIVRESYKNRYIEKNSE
ncbi:hypothetical protein V1478_015519 [Vespula squamosa]|uniref:Uncharacterized protein n=1 Tax=Vespula squamosa TaxID=30214 RepID=A0ABD2A630_VESSQ